MARHVARRTSHVACSSHRRLIPEAEVDLARAELVFLCLGLDRAPEVELVVDVLAVAEAYAQAAVREYVEAAGAGVLEAGDALARLRGELSEKGDGEADGVAVDTVAE